MNSARHNPGETHGEWIVLEALNRAKDLCGDEFEYAYPLPPLFETVEKLRAEQVAHLHAEGRLLAELVLDEQLVNATLMTIMGGTKQ